MKILKNILHKIELLEVVGSTNLTISGISFDSRKVTNGCLFVALEGTIHDGNKFIEQAVANGAIAIVTQKLPLKQPENVTIIKVRNSAKSLGLIASNYYKNPSENIKLIAVTGTNGKTSVATLLHDFFQSNGQKSGLISTIENKIGMQSIPSTHTTPDAISTNQLLAKMISEDCKYCFMEASSHALHQNRLSGLNIDGAIFTNISHDHLDYHQTFEDYIIAKKILFDHLPASAFALVNKDDKHGLTMLHHCPAKQYTYALKSVADFKAKVLESQFDGMLLTINGRELWTKLVGHFNAYNLLAIYATAILLGQDEDQTLATISDLNSAQGRFTICRSLDQKVGIVDYAHTPDALLNILQAINEIKHRQQLITVFGCGGDRDKDKRSKMGQIASQLSEKVIVTSDNPRNEKPEIIIQEILKGVSNKYISKVLTISDRKSAIKTACTLANAGDIILVAGKGHEKYQEIEGRKIPFDDRQELQNNFKILQE
ncbi:MAG: UDP-N-acetylmuramoyl-L-alanyl-D-glutamate--2,6-diaminopimelate ligase [Bacteroidota bacterium]|nr:UDP-N-acetylmuramoyl-L-alanyl-D-glutamate--2,6-diaminopimelate ligase [Bacteroidota bacterium]